MAGPAGPGRFLARLHLGDPGQLVRRRGDGGEPLLPEPPAPLPVPGAARTGVPGRGRGGRRRGRVPVAGPALAPGALAATGRPRLAPALPGVAGRADDA